MPTFPGHLVNSYVLRDDDGQATLLDAGLKGAPPRLRDALRFLGIGPRDVTRIVMTHAHNDHAGGLARMASATGAAVTVHAADAPYLRAGRAPELDQSTLFGRLVRDGGTFGAVEVSQEIVDGDLLDVAGGLRAVATPGHSPGHVSYLHEPSRLLITGDALFNWRRRISWPPSFLCTDIALSRRTAAVLADLDYDTVAFMHGPEIRTGARAAVRDFLRRQGAGR